MILKFIKLTVLLFFLSFSLNAQEYEKINGAWNAVFIDHGLSDKISIRSEFHLRTVSFLRRMESTNFSSLNIFLIL